MLKEKKEGCFVQIDVQMLLDSFETPAVFYRENTVRYFNEWAGQLFPAIAAGKGLPEEFFAPTSAFVPEAHEMQRGTLYLLRPRHSEVPAADLARFSQEVRSCLTCLTAAADQLSQRAEVRSAPDARQLLESTNRSLYRLRRLVDHSDLLRQLEQGEQRVYREGAVDLAGLCREMSAQLEQLAAQSGIRFRLDCRAASLVLLGDSELLQRMLLNLISNAMRAAGSGGEVGLRLEPTGDRAKIVLWDSGSGMEAEQLHAIFRPQPRRHRLSRPRDGAAMGLRLVQEIIVLHKGVILAENRPGGGLTMTVSLPLRKVPPTALRSAPAWGDDGFQLLLTELADVLPAALYAPEDLDG